MNLLETNDGGVSRETVVDALQRLGIRAGDTVMVHASLFSIGRIPAAENKEDVLDGFVLSLLEVLGADGTLIAPTFTLSFCKTGCFDVDRSRSEMGVLSERIRMHPLAKRTPNPIHSVAVIGKQQNFFIKASPRTSFGQGSVFDLIHQDGGVKFLTIGIANPTEAITYVHYVEEMCHVPYRKNIIFCGIVRSRESESEQKIDYFARNPPDRIFFNQERCFDLVKTAGIYSSRKFGDSMAYLIAERDYDRILREAIAKEPKVLCR